jgi:serine/threonine protein kinase
MADPSPTVSSGPPTVEDFLKTVARSKLIEPEQLQELVRNLPPEQTGDSQSLADHLVRIGKLSRFQASKLLQGVAKGLILGSFQVLALIGKGAMGKVYLARDSRDGQLVALKVLPPRRARAKERLVARFQREMELSRLVAHPNLCRTFEVGQFHGIHYIAMEFIPGKTLTKVVNEQGPLPLSRAARLMAEVASGLEHAHRQGLIHRDLKPSNIMVTPHDHAKLLDLGLALLQGEDVEDPSVIGGQGYIVGTMDYIAPEQTTDAAGVTARADIYALGCTLYFVLTGQPPFPGGTHKEKIRRHRKDRPEPLSNLQPLLPPAFVGMVEKMMAKDPRQRYPSARAVEESLWLWTEGSPIQPLDREQDSGFIEAVEMLRRLEPTSEGSSWAELDLPSETGTSGDVPLDGSMRVTWFSLGMLLGLATALGVVIGLVIHWLRNW